MLLTDQVAIVTGGGSGIGRASALRFAEEGASVVVADNRPQAAYETVALLERAGHRAVACEVDVADERGVAGMISTALDAFGTLDALFNNAGVNVRGDATTLSVDDWDRVMAVNVRSVFLGAKYAIPVMAAKGGGAIVSTSSMAGLLGVVDGSAYSCSKAAVINLTRSLAVTYGRDGIRVTCVCPGAVESPNMARRLEDPEVRRRVSANHPVGRVGQPEDIAGVAAWLLSPEASFITGETIVADGGVSALSHIRRLRAPRDGEGPPDAAPAPDPSR
jgi:NAD(P)-dependent dehydrogenase (short-subunit alcohol dehydrogenase family)